MFRRGLTVGTILAFCAGLFLNSADAHDFPLHTVVTAFVKMEPRELHLVIRVPLDLLRSVPFPMEGHLYLLAASGPATQQALAGIADGIPIYEDGKQLVPSSAIARLSLPSDRSFENYDQAQAHVAGPIEPGTEIYFEQGYLDAHLIYHIGSPSSVFTIQTILAPDLGDYLKLTVRCLPLDGSSRAFMITSRDGAVPLNPRWYQAAEGFVGLGVEHILSGIDHLLFLLCLLIPFRRIRDLIPVITAFTLGHSVTLIGSAYNFAPSGVWFPPFVETAIAASIVYMALENIVGANLRRRWLITGMFGLVHGFGFSYALKEQLQFAGSHLLVSLFSFNIGIELGQLAVLVVMVAGLALLFRGALAGRVGIVLLSAIIAHTAWHWMIDRGQVLWQTGLPRLDAPGLIVLSRWVAALLIAAGAARILAKWVERRWPDRVRTAE